MPPMISLESINLDASYTWGTTSPSQSGFSLRLDIALSLYLGGGLQDAKDDYDDPELQYGSAAQLYGQVLYDKGKWQITASVYDLSISHLLCFWDLEDRDSILQYFGKINIEYVKIKYEFNRKEGSNPKIPSRLLVEGQFEIDSVATLTMTYENEGGDDWGFTAGLRPSDKTGDNATIGKLLSSFLDAELVLILPKAIKDADIAKGKGDEALRILCCKRDGLSIFACLVKIGNVSVWFVQLRQGKDGPVKRMLKASISKISVEVSAFQTTISSPWEDLFFMWVQDTTSTEGNGSNKAGTPGITKQEYDIMVEILKDKAHVTDDQLHLFKPRGNESVSEDPALSSWVTEDDDIPDPAQKETVIAAGSHLVVVTKTLKGTSEVILDHLFGVKKQKSKGSGASFDHQSQHEQKSLPKYANAIAPAPKNSKQPDPSGSEKGVKAPLKAKVGPLSVSNVGLWFKDGMIGVTLDATLIMGPLGLSLLGFTIGVPFGEQYSLANPPPPTAIEWGLQGLILAMDKPPLTIAGGFMRDTSNENVEVMYTGGLVVGFKPWSFEAMGAYATVYKTETNSGEWITTIDTKPLNQYSLLSLQEDRESTHCQELEDGKRETFTFSFIYVKMNGPLFSVGFADVAGLVGGFGINSDITLPTVEQVIQFPFVAERDSSTESSPVQRMQELMEGPWFRPAEGLYWAAAGARVTAFQMFAANIVLVLQFGNGNLLFGIFGVATCDVPSLQAPVKFAHVELGIVCTFDVNSGIFKFEAQLSPRSFVLAPQCHLTGGMALFSWTKDELSDPKNKISGGDWVLTIGGYHRAFLPPKQYPKPPRLGISWSLSSCLSVKGEAYFAITPKVCMGGGRIRAAMSVGLLYAWFDAFMDFLMNFDPFYFQMTARVSVGVRFTLDLWLVTIRISVEIGAGLDLMGPPFGGVVHVDFWVFGFDIKFGASPRAPSAIDLDRFFKVATKTSSSSSASSRGLLVDRHNETSHSQANAQPDTAAILLTCETGLLPPLQDMKKKPVTPCVDDSELDNGKWYVKGANFSLNASFQIPITTARLTEKRTEILSGGKKQEETRYTDCNIAEQYQKVYAKPMQLYDPLTSVVSISVKAPEPKKKKTQDIHIFEDWKDQKWKLTAQVKPVQSSIWGQYNRNLDPSQVKGPIEGLLNGDNATMKLVTGISIVPPDPAMAGDKVNKFNVTKDHMASVFDSEKDEWPLFIGVTKMQEPAWQPKQRGKMWGDFRDNWNSIGDETTMKAVDLWAKRMRYDKESVDEGQKDENLKKTFNPLSGVAPKKLIRNYEQLVPALPLVAVGY